MKNRNRKLRSCLFLCMAVAVSMRTQSQKATPTHSVNTITAAAQAQPGVQNTYSISASTTSAGVYLKDGTLVRTLWNNVYKAAGTYTVLWDGTDDAGKPTPVGDYDIKILTNNITAEWQGVIGNTLVNQPGYLNFINGIAFNSKFGYVSGGYQEQGAVAYKFSPSNINVMIPILGKGPTTDIVSADENNVYWAANHYEKTFVYVTNVSNDQEHPLANSQITTVQYSNTYSSAIDVYQNNTNAKITGLAVQKNGNYLFVAHGLLNELHVINKLSGELINNISISYPRELAVDGAGNLWMTSGNNNVSKYVVSASGSIGGATVTLSGIAQPSSLAVNGNTIYVADRGTQQIRNFSLTGTVGAVFGTAGGYSTNPAVYNNKFYWSDLRYGYSNAMAVQADGTFWVIDGGNSRVQHYDQSFTIINRFQWLGHFYSSTLDKGNSEKIFANFMEFSTDYNKLAKDQTGWKLVNNWGYKMTADKDDEFFRLFNVCTMSNGKTYALTGTNTTSYLVELVAAAGIRYTGQTYPKNTQLYKDGLYTVSIDGVGTPTVWSKRILTGFDASNNPKFASASTLQTVNNPTNQDPIYTSNIGTLTSGEVTSTGQYISFNGSTTGYSDHLGFHAVIDSTKPGTGYHIGAVKNNKWLWKTAPITYSEYRGPFPSEGAFDIGNEVGPYSGSRAFTSGRYIIWGYHGEFYRGGQTNYWNLLWDNGLTLKQFGTQNNNSSIQPNGMAGNSYAANFLMVGTSLYLYTNDEGTHSGIHRWKISNLSSASELILPITASFPRTSEDPAAPGIDLMADLPFNTVLPNNTAGWVRTPATDVCTNRWGDYWSVRTNVRNYNKRKRSDLFINFFMQPGESATVTRSLGNNTNLSSWTLTGSVNFEGNNFASDIPMPIEVLDDAGKVLVRFKIEEDWGSASHAMANNTQIATSPYDGALVTTARTTSQPISFKMENGVFKVSYSNYPVVTVNKLDPAGNVNNPRYLRIPVNNYHNNAQEKVIDLQDFRFVPVASAGARVVQPEFSMLNTFR